MTLKTESVLGINEYDLMLAVPKEHHKRLEDIKVTQEELAQIASEAREELVSTLDEYFWDVYSGAIEKAVNNILGDRLDEEK